MPAHVTVVNVRYSHYEKYIGRTMPDGEGGRLTSALGNPHLVGVTCPACPSYVVHRRGEAVAAFERDFLTLLCRPSFAQAIDEIEAAARTQPEGDYRLGCWCKNKSGVGQCHGDVIATHVNKRLAKS